MPISIKSDDGGTTGTMNVSGNPAAVFAPGHVLPVTSTLGTLSYTLSWDAEVQGQFVSVKLTQNHELPVPSNTKKGAYYAIRVLQDAIGNRQMFWGTGFKFPNDVIPILSTSGNRADYFTFYCHNPGTLELIGESKNIDGAPPI